MSISSGTGREDIDRQMEYYSAIKNEIMSFAKWMDLEIIMLNKSEEDKYHMISPTYGI